MNLRTLTTTVLTAAALTLGLTAPASADVVTLSGDWNGDGTATTATYDRDRAWFTGAGMSFRYGRPGDLPLVGDWDGDGRDELGINRGKWMHLRTSLGPGIGDVSWWYGWETDTPVVGDWNLDGRDEVAVLRGPDLYIKRSHTGGPADYVAPAHKYRTARATLDALGCGDVVLEFATIPRGGGLAYWQETPQRIVLDPRTNVPADVAAHECGHARVWDVFHARYPSSTEHYIYATLNAITGEDGTMGSEVIADCFAVRHGYSPGYLFSPGYCEPYMPTVDAILADTLPVPPITGGTR